MATKIVTKNSSTASAVPTASDLVQGELAVNVADKRLFTEDNAGAIVELGTNPSTLTVTGEITANGGIALGDSDKATFGAGDDLQIYHDGNHSYVSDQGTGSLRIQATDLGLETAAGNQNYLTGVTGGAVTLFHNGSTKLATTSTGIDITGNLTMASGGSIVAGGANDLILNAGESGTPDIYLQSGSSTKVKIEGSNGNVGIGTSSPNAVADLHVADTSDARIWLDATSADTMELYSGTGVGMFNRSNSYLMLGTNNTERMRIDSSGHTMFATTDTAPGAGNTNTGISLRGGADNRSFFSTSNHYTLHLNRNTSDGEILYFAKDGTAVGSISSVGGADIKVVLSSDGDQYITGNSAANYMSFSAANQERMRIDSSGNLLVGTTSTSVTNTNGIQLFPASGGANKPRINIATAGYTSAEYPLSIWSTAVSAWRFYVQANGTISAVNTTITSLSDERIKENIRDLDDGLSKVMQLQPRKFDWKEGKGKDISDDRGFIAQEFEQVFPDMISEWKDEAPEGEEAYKAINANLIPTLVKAIQEQQTLIESLTTRIAALEE